MSTLPKPVPAPAVPVLGPDGSAMGEFRLPDGVATLRASTLHQVVTAVAMNKRHGNASTKTRGEVSGGGRKPWRQKGTGRARQGSTRAPHWRHGGVAFGPHPRSYRLGINSSESDRSVLESLAVLARQGRLAIVPRPDASGKTKALAGWLRPLRGEGAPHEATVLLLVDSPEPGLVRGARNLVGVALERPERADATALMKSRRVLATAPALSSLLLRVGGK